MTALVFVIHSVVLNISQVAVAKVLTGIKVARKEATLWMVFSPKIGAGYGFSEPIQTLATATQVIEQILSRMLFTSSQLHQLIRALLWLTGLTLLSFTLLISSWAWLDRLERPEHIVQLQCGGQPTFRVKSAPISTPILKKGQSLFVTHCQSCHEMSDTKRIGPGLLGVMVRAPDPAWLMRWIKNPTKVLQSGDVYANQLVKDYTPVVMPSFPKLKEADLKAILSYLDSYTVEEVGSAESPSYHR